MGEVGRREGRRVRREERRGRGMVKLSECGECEDWVDIPVTGGLQRVRL